jgi:hypothetical protein
VGRPQTPPHACQPPVFEGGLACARVSNSGEDQFTSKVPMYNFLICLAETTQPECRYRSCSTWALHCRRRYASHWLGRRGGRHRLRIVPWSRARSGRALCIPAAPRRRLRPQRRRLSTKQINVVALIGILSGGIRSRGVGTRFGACGGSDVTQAITHSFAVRPAAIVDGASRTRSLKSCGTPCSNPHVLRTVRLDSGVFACCTHDILFAIVLISGPFCHTGYKQKC